MTIRKQSLFTRFARGTAKLSGKPVTFMSAVAVIIVWGASGPLFGFSDTWQLVINTSTTIITFLMVFLIQNTQNRDSKAVQLKLDELISAIKGAHNDFLDIEDDDEMDLEDKHRQMVKLAQAARDAIENKITSNLLIKKKEK